MNCEQPETGSDAERDDDVSVAGSQASASSSITSKQKARLRLAEAAARVKAVRDEAEAEERHRREVAEFEFQLRQKQEGYLREKKLRDALAELSLAEELSKIVETEEPAAPTVRFIPVDEEVSTKLHQVPTKSYPKDETPQKVSCCHAEQNTAVSLEAVAQALRQRPALPKVELTKFSGDPGDFAEFRTSFRVNIEVHVESDSERFLRLLSLCEGRARDAIKGCVNLPVGEMYEAAWASLSEYFGQPHMVASCQMKRLRDIQLKTYDASALMRFASRLEDAKRTLDSLGPDYALRLDSDDLIKDMMKKLDDSLRKRWVERAGYLLEAHQRVTFDDFTNFVKGLSRRLNNVFGEELRLSQTFPKSRVTAFVATSSRESEDNVKESSRYRNPRSSKTTCPFCEGDHKIWRCEKFSELAEPDRYIFVMKARLCLRCLQGHHRANQCHSRLTCNACKSIRHNTLLHRTNELQSKADGSLELPVPDVKVGSTRASIPGIWLKVLPVRVNYKDRSVIVNAFLDGGSDATLCTRDLLNRLGIEGEDLKYRLSTLTGDIEVKGVRATLSVSSVNGGECHNLSCISTDQIPLDRTNFAHASDLEGYSHLHDIPWPNLDDDSVSILIGSDNAEIIESQLDKRVGGKGEPIAVLTCLGWTISGPNGRKGRNSVSVNRLGKVELAIEEKLRYMYDNEFQGLVSSDQTVSCPNDVKAMKIMEDSIELVNGHFNVAMPFKGDAFHQLTGNFPMAERRLKFLRNKLERDGSLKESYYRVMQKYLDDGAARRVGRVDMADRWYLPHHAVISNKKPDPRIVFDCAAEYRGKSLNSALYKGPDNTSPLLEVLMRFRADTVAVVADIKSMFHQVKVKGEDSKKLSFLWWPDKDMSRSPETYEMTSHVFGATSSPSVCGFALQQCAVVHSSSPEAKEAVRKSFYVDDMLHSFPDVNSAIQGSKEIASLLRTGGFHLTKWLSNRRELLETVEVDERSPSVKSLNLDLDSLSSDKTLGVRWDVENDELLTDVTMKDLPRNRRGVLASVASIYDPLGMASPLVLKGKLINQELCKRKLGWDDELPDDVLCAWNEWKEDIQGAKGLGVPRCLRPEVGVVSRIELHHFSDASDSGYGTVSYIRFVGELFVLCSFVYARSRVKPLKSGVTIPKLELAAATLLVSVDHMIKSSLKGRLTFDETYYWTDSTIVLKYIYNETKDLTVFVANRVAKIREYSCPNQWRHVRTHENPADIASRGIKPTERERWQMWSRGPDFLLTDVKFAPIPTTDEYSLDDEDEGVKQKCKALATFTTNDFWSVLLKRYSCWTKLVRVIAWLRRAVCKFKRMHRAGDESLTVEEIAESEKLVFKQVQSEVFGDATKAVGDAALLKLKPVMKDGLMCVGGRLQRSDLPEQTKHPVILPSKHCVTDLLILFYHVSNGHIGAQHTLSMMRQEFWIIRGLATVRKVIGKCHFCKRHNQKLGEQVMASLPSDRVTSESSFPFEVTGVDLFGPLYVTTKAKTRSQVTRTSIKRYGVLFTCMKCRAIHLEIALDLSTDSFINTLLRFIARRGPPRILISDNGTNFRGAAMEVVEGLTRLNHERITNVLSEKRVEWKFNCPAASHRGGAWERLVRSVRKVLCAQLRERAVNEDTLHTYLCEVEKIINDRPLTKLSDDPRDMNSITPNHILLIGRNPSRSMVCSGNVDLRVRWKLVQSLADEFWARWRKEYLVTLQERQKWVKEKRNFQVGDLVLLFDKGLPRGSWNKALITEVVRGDDNCVREVVVRHAEGILRRDVRKICLLEEGLCEPYLSA